LHNVRTLGLHADKSQHFDLILSSKNQCLWGKLFSINQSATVRSVTDSHWCTTKAVVPSELIL